MGAVFLTFGFVFLVQEGGEERADSPKSAFFEPDS